MTQPQLLKPDEEKRIEAHQFLHDFSSVILSTSDKQGVPHSSYAPHFIYDGHFYVFVSSLAKHAQTLALGQASLFFIESEKTAKRLFARTRLTIDSQVMKVDPATINHTQLLDIFQKSHGQTVKLLRKLPDFTLYQLTPKSAQFVTGFGAAYDLSPHMHELLTT